MRSCPKYQDYITNILSAILEIKALNKKKDSDIILSDTKARCRQVAWNFRQPIVDLFPKSTSTLHLTETVGVGKAVLKVLCLQVAACLLKPPIWLIFFFYE